MENNYQNFTEKNGGRQLTRWMKKEQLVPYVETFHRYHGDCYGREYVIKSNRKKIKPRWAIFIKKENKLRRQADAIMQNKMSIIDLVMLNLNKKQEGVSILKTVGKSL